MPVRLVATVSGDNFRKIIPFVAADQREYLLLTGSTSGQVSRLDPETGEIRVLAGNLNAPTAIALDPFTGDLFVAEKDRVRRIPDSQLNQGLTTAPLGDSPEGAPEMETVAVLGESLSGISLDACTGISICQTR